MKPGSGANTQKVGLNGGTPEEGEVNYYYYNINYQTPDRKQAQRNFDKQNVSLEFKD